MFKSIEEHWKDFSSEGFGELDENSLDALKVAFHSGALAMLSEVMEVSEEDVEDDKASQHMVELNDELDQFFENLAKENNGGE